MVGGTGQLGRRIATRLSDAGGRVLVSGRNPEPALPGAVGSVAIDLMDNASIFAGTRVAVELLGGLDGVVLASGVVGFGLLEQTPVEAVDEIVQVNLTGPLVLLAQLIPHLDGGFLVAISGVVAEQPPAGMVPYAASKSGLSAALTALSRELRRRNVHVLEARPPHTETGLANRPVTGIAPALPAGLSPDHVADVIVGGVMRGVRRLEAGDF